MSTGKAIAVLHALVLGAFALGCGSGGNQLAGAGGQGGRGGTGGQGGGGNSQTTTETATFVQEGSPKVDILFVLDDWASTSGIQAKLDDQLPTFLHVLQSLPAPLDLHVAVTTADMGAPGDATDQIGCPALGDNGAFQSKPRGSCLSTTLMNGATYLADDGNGTANFTDPMASVLQCISLVGGSGCGIPQPLAAATHALGADNVVNGVPTPPATNVGFLRPDAYLAIIFLANQDDCSAPAGTQLFSLDGGEQNLANPLGPLGHYRCNQFGHLCKDPASSNPQALIMPPLNPPSDAQGATSNPTLDLTNCQDNDEGTGLLTPVSKLVADIKALKKAPDGQIMVAAISSPPTPYAVAWVPGSGGSQAGELWPEIEHSCGNFDGSFGDPAVRLAAFVNGFPQSVLGSNCDASYASSMTAIVTKIDQLVVGDCLTGTIQENPNTLPNCAVSAQVPDSTGTTKSVSYESCAANGNTSPCWTLSPGTASCAGESLSVVEASGAESSSISVSCQICKPGATVPGC